MEKYWGYCKYKTENQRQEAKAPNLRTPENSWLQGTFIGKRSSQNLHTYTETKHHPRANKFQSKPYHSYSPAMQEHSPEHQYTGCPKSHQTHRHLKTHYWTLHYTPDRRNPAPPTRTQTQASLTRKHWQAARPTLPTERHLHNKEEQQTARIQKGHCKHSNLNKVKRQRNTQQVKEHDKSPPNQTKEEIVSLPEKEFRKVIVKMNQNLENKMALQISSLETGLRRCKKCWTRT